MQLQNFFELLEQIYLKYIYMFHLKFDPLMSFGGNRTRDRSNLVVDRGKLVGLAFIALRKVNRTFY